VTDDRGWVSFDVPRVGHYLILEDSHGQAKIVTDDGKLPKQVFNSQPLIVSLPYFSNGVEQNEIHLYPKAYEGPQDIYFQKVEAMHMEGLGGVEFVIYQKDNDGNKNYLLKAKDTDGESNLFTGTKAMIDAYLADSSETGGLEIRKSNSDSLMAEIGKTSVGQHYFFPGTYGFEEIKTIDGYEFTEAEKNIEFTIDVEGKVTFSYKDDTSIPLGELQVLNEEEIPDTSSTTTTSTSSTSTKDPPGSSTTSTSKAGVLPNTEDPPSSSRKGSLPVTGEELALLLLIIGIVTIFIVLILFIKKKREKKEYS